jgi:endonuclease/exonuclease/phosphatase family metal-dependent hydrolase
VRFVTWNCAIGQFRGKAKAIAPLKPDILAVQEVESLITRVEVGKPEEWRDYSDHVPLIVDIDI